MTIDTIILTQSLLVHDHIAISERGRKRYCVIQTSKLSQSLDDMLSLAFNHHSQILSSSSNLKQLHESSPSTEMVSDPGVVKTRESELTAERSRQGIDKQILLHRQDNT
jgi:hypothetical protein